jgi:hypothetical protein
MENIYTTTVLNTLDIGKMINSMGKEKRPGQVESFINNCQMALITRGNMWKVRSMVVGSLYSLTDLNMKENSIITIFTDQECISGRTRGNTMENGSAIRCTERELQFGQIAVVTMESK